MKDWLKQHINLKAWGIFGFTTLLAIWSWLSLSTNNLTNSYRLFPLLGLLAFSTMVGHYIIGALRSWCGADHQQLASYSKYTRVFVLFCILMHPGLIAFSLWRDGLGTPPESYKLYVGEAVFGYVMIGMIALLAFLAYEFSKWLKKYQLVWRLTLWANHAAMLIIYVHASLLGKIIDQPPLKFVWWIYGLGLAASYIYLGHKRKLG